MDAIELAKQAAIAAHEKKGSRIMILDLRDMSDICDFQMICSGTNTRQTQAIADNISARCKKTFGISPLAVEGKQGGFWVLLDYGSTIIHIFSGTLRDYYAIEELWPKAKVITLSTESKAATKPVQTERS